MKVDEEAGGEKKVGNYFAENEKVRRRVTSPMAERMARRNNWIHSVSLIYFRRMSAAVYNSRYTDNTLPFYLRYPRGILFKCPATNFNTEYRRFHLLAFHFPCEFRGEFFIYVSEKINAHLGIEKKTALQFLNALNCSAMNSEYRLRDRIDRNITNVTISAASLINLDLSHTNCPHI